jgi:hypothetical protein
MRNIVATSKTIVRRPQFTRRIRPGRSMSVVLLAGLAALSAVLCRRRLMRWGSTDAEVELVLAGDDLLPASDLTSTRSITVEASATQVWPWIAQLGQGRGGFYSYDFLENLVGLHIHSADRIHPEWQHLTVGSSVQLAAQIALTVAVMEPDRALVLRGGVPGGAAAVPYDFTWAFTLHSRPDGTTRIIVRERYCYLRRSASLIVQPAASISCLMSTRMLRGIKRRAELESQHGSAVIGTAPVDRGISA